MTYFYAGETKEVRSRSKLFCGIWEAKETDTHVDVFNDIVKWKEEEFGRQVCLTAMSALPELNKEN